MIESEGFPFSFTDRHLGPNAEERTQMLQVLGLKSMDDLITSTVPQRIRLKERLLEKVIGPGKSEPQALADLKALASENQVFKSYIGMGYSDTIAPGVILRNITENPGWYTQYTPYQAEISQGRLEALLNFQTMLMDLTGMEIANASMLDEGTAAAEAMAMALAIKGREDGRAFFIASDCHPQTIAVVRTRAEPLGIPLIIEDAEAFKFDRPIFGALLQYPATDGNIRDYRAWAEKAHTSGALVIAAADPLALVLIEAPGVWGADIVVGSTQRFGVPMGYGGPHAAYLATRDAYKRQLPGRIVGVSKDVDGKPGIRLALQTREQHIRRDKATSNICTAQVLLAVMASMYAVYHGPRGLKRIAERVHGTASELARALEGMGYALSSKHFFDTLRIKLGDVSASTLISLAHQSRINLRKWSESEVCIAVDEATTAQDLASLLSVFAKARQKLAPAVSGLDQAYAGAIPSGLERKTPILTHSVFNQHHSETEMLRYITKLQSRDLSLAHSMIPLGSCTMKLNATSEMIPVTWPEINAIHPFAPLDQARGYQKMLKRLEDFLSEVTGFPGISLQPNAGSQGEYAGLLVIRSYLRSKGQTQRNVCLIPQSAHGTNPASAVMAGMKVVVTACDSEGNVDLADLRAKADEHKDTLAALMVTYPSTHGVFEEAIGEICEIIHSRGGQVYMDGANMNAQVGLCRPGDFGPDVCHLNLHKTFCIPHGGGGPGMGPIGVQAHLKPFLPSHPVVEMGIGPKAMGPVSAAPWGSPSILPISYLYIEMMGVTGLELATQTAILSANYVARKLEGHYPVLYKGRNGFVAHECILDFRPIKASSGVEVEDVAKRLMDYGFHAPTISFPVPGTLMVEPTESEPKVELDRFVEAMISIREEIREIEEGKADRSNNLLKNAPHTAEQLLKDGWSRPYSRERAAYPHPSTRDFKFWPPVGRIDNVYGERNLVCACLPIEAYKA